MPVLQPPRPPGVVLELPPPLQPRDRTGRQGRPVPQEPPQRQLEVPLGQPMQVEFGQEGAHRLSPPLKQRQNPALEAPHAPPHPRPLHRDRPGLHGHAPRRPVAVPVARRGIHRRPPLRRPPPQQRRDFLLQERLDERLHLPPRKRLERLPRRPGRRGQHGTTLLHGDGSFLAGHGARGCWSQPEGYVASRLLTHLLVVAPAALPERVPQDLEHPAPS